MCYYCLFLFWGGAFRVLWQWLCILPEYKGNSYPTICSMFVATISILSCCAIKQKEPRRIAEALSGIIHLRKQSARSRDRTGTGVTPLVFETNASTNSAIRAVDISFLRQTECKGNERPRIVQYPEYDIYVLLPDGCRFSFRIPLLSPLEESLAVPVTTKSL